MTASTRMRAPSAPSMGWDSSRDELPRYKSAIELGLMRRIKRALDPQGLMNPGKVLQD